MAASIYVVDASVIVEELITGAMTPHAHAFFVQVRQQDVMYIPEFCYLECTNVLWQRVRRDGMPVEVALVLLRQLKALHLRRVPTKGMLSQALEIGIRNGLAIYDSSYIALARRKAAILITLDARQQRAGQAEGLTVPPITDFNP